MSFLGSFLIVIFPLLDANCTSVTTWFEHLVTHNLIQHTENACGLPITLKHSYILEDSELIYFSRDNNPPNWNGHFAV